ncbi:hypothetical protein I79_001329 [Cricetulus griseus]|uniref:Uncharacterized protein n=1 Tax=Cricetulus griseus TaxID=10029 RepID=G3GUG9_CRIGR|nr:hypothetical protein I79_001329 [Cricetulus griseus]
MPKTGCYLRILQHHSLYFTGWISGFHAQYLHGPFIQDAAAQVQLLQFRVGAQFRAEGLPPLYGKGLTLCPASAREEKKGEGTEQADLNMSDCHSKATGGETRL